MAEDLSAGGPAAEEQDEDRAVRDLADRGLAGPRREAPGSAGRAEEVSVRDLAEAFTDGADRPGESDVPQASL